MIDTSPVWTHVRVCPCAWGDTHNNQNIQSQNSQAFGTYASSGGTKLTYRVKKSGTYGGYKIITEVG